MAVSSLERAGAEARRRPLVVVAIALAVLLLLLVAATLIYDHSRRDVIANGVRIAGVPVGGLHAAAARSKLERDLASQLNEPVTVTSGSRHWTLGPREAAVRLNVAGMVQQAVDASREGSIITRTFRGVTGGSLNRNIPLAVSYSHHAVRELAARIRADVNRAPRDATVSPSAASLHPVPGVVGLAVVSSALSSRIRHALLGQAPSRTVHVPTHHIQPAVSIADLAHKYPAYIVVDRSEFKLRFFSHLKLSKSYEIAVGMEGLETPAGLHHIEWEQVDPPWLVPKKAWAGALAGTVVPPGPADPLKARFMSFEGGAGIHGIDPSEYSSIGQNASHGCIRMRIPDVIALYDVSPVGTPVYII